MNFNLSTKCAVPPPVPHAEITFNIGLKDVLEPQARWLRHIQERIFEADDQRNGWDYDGFYDRYILHRVLSQEDWDRDPVLVGVHEVWILTTSDPFTAVV